MTTVYLVTDGDYSDYKVLCVCSTMAKADEARRLYNAYNEIEMMTLDDMPARPKGMWVFTVQMDAAGQAVRIKPESVERIERPDWMPYGDHGTVIFTMWARDEKHAVKIANEKRAMLIATNQWTVDHSEWREKRTVAKTEDGE